MLLIHNPPAAASKALWCRKSGGNTTLTLCIQYQIKRQGCAEEEEDGSRYVKNAGVKYKYQDTDLVHHRIQEVRQEEEVNIPGLMGIVAIFGGAISSLDQGVWCWY